MSHVKSNLVSTIIPVYNRSRFLTDAVNSVLNQTYHDIEIILVDDGSTDETVEKIAELVSSNPKRVRSLRIKNSGPGGAREHGRLNAQGEYIQYLDSDDFLEPNKFAVQVEVLRKNHPKFGVAYGITRLVDDNGCELISPYKLTGRRVNHLFPDLLVDRWWNTHTPLYHRSVVDRVGPWPSTRMGEDWLYDARVGALRTKLAFCDEVVSNHRQHHETRLTGGQVSPASLRDFGFLLPQLYECATQAGVPHDCKEMQHFSRWAFSVARQLGCINELKLATDCFQVARDSDFGSGFEFRAFSLLVRIFGWRIAGWSSETLRSICRKQPSSASLKQSWM